MYWWTANKQQPGRGSIGKNALDRFIVLDVESLSDQQLDAAESVFEAVANKQLQPIHQIAVDEARARLDRMLMVEVLGMPSHWHDDGGIVDLLRKKLAAEPSIRGHKN